jgi:hypothetical protein
MVTAVFAYLAFRKQSDQLSEERKFNKEQMCVLSLQADELKAAQLERRQEAQSRRREQAAQVFFSIKFREQAMTELGVVGVARLDTYEVIVVNNSELPVWDLVVRWHRGTAPWNYEGSSDDRQAVLFPAKQSFTRVQRVNGERFPPDASAVIEFRDASGLHWRRRSNGELDELGADVA